MDPIKFKSRIISALRKLTYSWGPRKNVTQAAKRAPATFECIKCNYWCYTGKSDKNFEKLKEEFPKQKLKMEATRDDHIDPVVSPKDGFVDWNTLVERIFCPEENWQVLCKSCHDEKTAEERKERQKWKKKKK